MIYKYYFLLYIISKFVNMIISNPMLQIRINHMNVYIRYTVQISFYILQYTVMISPKDAGRTCPTQKHSPYSACI